MVRVSLGQAFAAEENVTRTALSNIFEEEPVGLDVFIRDKKFLGSDWKLSPLQSELVQTVERIYLPSLYPLMAKEFGGYWAEVENLPMKNLISAQWGKGGGKDHCVRVASLRVSYLLLCLKSPQQYFGMPTQDSIHMLNIAANAGQANRAFFKPMTQAVKVGWFKDKAEPKRDTIDYDKNLQAISGHSDAEGQEGLNLIIGVADEIDAFKAKNEMVGAGKKAREASTSAESILKMLKGSASTRFPENYKRVAISYPRYKGSTIQQLTAEAKKDIKEMGDSQSIYFASGPYATWEVNPRVVGPESFASDYRKNPDEAAAMYECKPSRSSDPYFKQPGIFKNAVDRPFQPIKVSYKLTQVRSEETGFKSEQWEPVFDIDPDFKPIAGARYAIHADLAIKGDRAGVAMSHVVDYEEIVESVTGSRGEAVEKLTQVPHVRNDFTIVFESAPADTYKNLPVREIQIRWVRVLLFELMKRDFYVVRMTYDQFQSADSMQMMKRHGIDTARVSTDLDEGIWRNLRDLASDGRLKMPANQLLQNELEGLSKVGNKVDHAPGSSKDAADAFASSIQGAIVAGGRESEDHEQLEPANLVLETPQPLFELAWNHGAVGNNGAINFPALTRGAEPYGY